jgi:GTP-binding protein
MVIKTIEFIISAAAKAQFPVDQLPQVMLLGRSNVGKSSFINAILNNSKVARVSQTPGKTRLLNFFRINNEFYFVDLPGYGFANIDKQTIGSFQKLIEGYLESDSPIWLGVLLLDIRRKPSKDDLLMQAYLLNRGIDILYVLTKVDKLSNNQRAAQLKIIKQTLDIFENDDFVMFSSKTKENRNLVLEKIAGALSSEV